MKNRWPTKSLGDLAGCGQYGLNAAAMSEGTGVRFIRITDITQGGELRQEEPAYVPEGTVGLDSYELKDGDVLIARSGATAGKSYVHRPFGERAVFAGYLIRFRPDTSQVLPRFIGAFLHTPTYWRQLNSHKRAVAQPNVNAKQLASLTLPVPPLAEQERVVKLLDQADGLRKLRAQADRRTATLIPAIYQTMFGDPMENPRGWTKYPVSSFVAELHGGRNVNPAGADDTAGRFRVLKISAVTWGEFRPDESKPLPADYEPPASHFVRAGDLLFSRANTTELVGATSYVFQTPANLLLPDKLWRFVWKTPFTVEPLFVWWLFQTASVRHELGQRATGTGGSMKNISKPKVMTLEVPLPPLPLQKEFAQRVADVYEMEAYQAASRRRLDDLFQSMLHRAFTGKL
jgi:type I restriction enzyme S subunit